MDAPDVLRAIHEDYLRAGADIMTTNTMCTSRFQLGTVGLADKWEEYTRRAVELAFEARARVNPSAVIAGSLAPTRLADVSEELADQSVVLADSGTDLLLLEIMSSIGECVRGIEAVAATSLPVFLGVRVVTGGMMESGESIEDLVLALQGLRADAVLPMCSQPSATSAALRKLMKGFDGPVGAYAHNWDDAPGLSGPFDRRYYADYVRLWLKLGVQVIGGCCGTTPEYIVELRGALDESRAKS